MERVKRRVRVFIGAARLLHAYFTVRAGRPAVRRTRRTRPVAAGMALIRAQRIRCICTGAHTLSGRFERNLTFVGNDIAGNAIHTQQTWRKSFWVRCRTEADTRKPVKYGQMPRKPPTGRASGMDRRNRARTEALFTLRGHFSMKNALRRILSESARLDVPADTLADDADLYAAGLSSLATVHLMLAIEDEFGIEIPDRMLTRRLFSSIDSLAAAVTELQQAKAAA
jgi:acyl carrier protein